MAKETRNNITQYFVEQLKRLSVAANTSCVGIWNRITAVMTDSVAKNLKIVPLIMEELLSMEPSKDIFIAEPYHLLCLIHTLECFDRKMLEQVKKIEDKLGLREQFVSKMPELKSFLSNKNKAIAESALEALCSLTYNSGKKSALWQEFLNECEASGGPYFLLFVSN